MSRYAFAGIEDQFVPLVRELEFVSNYLEVEKVRFANRLRVELPDASDAEDIFVPVLSLQPLIENAIRHGIANKMEEGRVSGRLRRDGNRFSLTVENDVDSAESILQSEFFRPGHSLDNIRERLRLGYGDRASIHFSSSGSATLLVTIKGPTHP
jgi:two-component system, LytTR family, sensor kinase